jgi:DNA-binding transcriptional MocR family regulator
MSNKHRKDKSKSPPRYVMINHWVMDTAAWKDISANARAIYLEILKRYNGSNNGRIGYSVRQAAIELKISRTTASRAIKELVSHGFIVAEQKGSFNYKMDANGKRKRLASEWRLTVYGSDVASDMYSQLHGSKEFTRWPEIQNTVSLQSPMVSRVKPYGLSGETVIARKQQSGPSGETKNADF